MADAANKPVALVTGAAQGIGEGIARALGEAGYVVVLGDVDGGSRAPRRPPASRNRGIEATGIRLDVTKAADWAEACTLVENRWGGLDVLVNNAASARAGQSNDGRALWDLTLDVNLKGPWLGIKAALPLLRSARGRSSTSARPGRRVPCRGSFPTSSARRGSGG